VTRRHRTTRSTWQSSSTARRPSGESSPTLARRQLLFSWPRDGVPTNPPAWLLTSARRRILDQLVYKWDHSRRIIAKVLIDKYRDIAATGWRLTSDDIGRDVRMLFKDNFLNFLSGN
jgi:hypothetical protein